MTTALLEPEEAVARGTDVVPDIHVYDDVLPDPDFYRVLALAHAFKTFEIGGEQWHGFAACRPTDIVNWLRDIRPDLTVTLSFLRQSPQGQQEPNFIHTDRGMGDWTALYYLNPSPPDGDGTDFWQHGWSGVTESYADSDVAMAQEEAAWRDTPQWSLRQHVKARFNRAVLFPAGYFHSRSLYDNYGHGETARLVQTVFSKQGV